jgi:hypothetical protein
LISRKFHTDNGVQKFYLKNYDGFKVPIGYYYESDLQERWKKISEIVKNSVIPIIERLIDFEIPKFFYLSESSISTLVYAGPFKMLINSKSIKEALQLVNQEYEFHDSLNLEFFINIEFETLEVHYQTKQYGCQILVTNGYEIVQNIKTDLDYKLWYLYLGNEKTLIDTAFTKDQENKIIGHFLGYLWQSEENIPKI